MKKIPSLNGLRAISVSIVILQHLRLFNDFPFKKGNTSPLLYAFIQFFSDGQLGVNVFFIISGFLITSLLLKEKKATHTVSLKKFYVRRILRIFPALYFLLLFYFVLQMMGLLQFSMVSWLSSLTYTKFLTKGDTYTAHLWSLSVEEWFYLIWPFIFLYASEKNQKRLLFSIMFIVPILRGVGHVYNTKSSYDIAALSDFSLLTRGDALSIGCLLAIYKDKIIFLISRRWNTYFISSLILLFLLSFPQYLLEKIHFNFLAGLLGGHSGCIANICISVIVMYSIYAPQKWWYHFLNCHIMEYIGILSYSIYLWQQFFTPKEQNWWPTHIPQNIFFIFGAALFSYYVIEKPFLKLKSRFSV